ncbi:hypothetical protein AMAG_05112 [Allomyces macrogynus ATCC 38327]|uniref:Uncharacterized protein n=1 Tax=Allomyces macrogynus (strain ATCC 38327) TaxID=578462 RepID=A0A0L0S7H6_ALLM3|nr:hypothetical protein AMAG_05112 [Allomyces macrogynus ATCC 38327]|eukprot:KNE58304.1 hypothetical protein AMAG_05112 [Allomyces macrogynus ATCC 38327]
MSAAAVPSTTTQAMLAFAKNLLADMHDMTRSLTGSPTATSPCASPTLRAASTMSPASLDASRAALEALHGAIADTVDSAALRVASVYLAAAAEAAAAEVGGTAMRVRECMLAAHEQVQVLGEAEGGAQPMQRAPACAPVVAVMAE